MIQGNIPLRCESTDTAIVYIENEMKKPALVHKGEKTTSFSKPTPAKYIIAFESANVKTKRKEAIDVRHNQNAALDAF